MLQFKTDTHLIEMEREAFEASLKQGILGKIDEMRKDMPQVYSLIKGALQTMEMFGQLPFEIPKGVNPVEFIAVFGLKIGLDMIDNKPLEVKAVVKEFPPEKRINSTASQIEGRIIYESN